MSALTIDDMNEYAQSVFEEVFAHRPGRASDGKKHQDREAVAYGWLSAMARLKRWEYFTDEAVARLRGAQ